MSYDGEMVHVYVNNVELISFESTFHGGGLGPEFFLGTNAGNVEIDEVVSNTDLAPTFCAIAGCELGPFKDGPERADGLSLLPLLDGETDHLERTLVREERSEPYADVPAWRAIRTTS